MAIYKVHIVKDTADIVNANTGAGVPIKFITNLYDNLAHCFPKSVPPRVNDKEAALVMITDGTKKLIAIPEHLRPRMTNVVNGPAGSQYRRDKTATAFYHKKHIYKLFVLEINEGEDAGKIVSSCRVHYDDGAVPPTREIHDVCSRMRASCVVLIPRVVQHLLKQRTGCSVKIFCENKNEGACACYRAIASSLVGVNVATVETNERTTFVFTNAVVGGRRRRKGIKA